MSTSDSAVRENARTVGRPTPRRMAPAVTLVVLGAALFVILALTTPWHPLPSTPEPVEPTRDFTAAEIARADAFNRALDPPAYLGLAAGLAAVLVLGLTPLGARLFGRAVGPLRRWPLQVVGAAVVAAALMRVVSMPFGAWSQTVLHRYGLSTQGWGGWALDQLRSFGVTAVVWVVVLLGLHVLMRRFPRRWWVGAAVGGFVAVLGMSFVYPVVVEPMFNSFRPMAAGPLRTDLLRMARADHVPVTDVLVADASRRTTTLNAYVSGFGSTRRIVVYDTVLTSMPRRETELIVAHELGHAKRHDVLYGTLVGALAVAAGACLLYLLVTSRTLTRRAGVASPADPRSIALLLAVATVAAQLAGPAENLVSRHIEARADVHSLNLTGDPATFVAMQRELSVRNLDDLTPNPFEYALWNTHPTGPERIALARDWARLHHVPLP